MHIHILYHIDPRHRFGLRPSLTLGLLLFRLSEPFKEQGNWT